MNNPDAAKTGLAFLKQVARATRRVRQPPEKGKISQAEHVLPFSVVRGTRGYVEATVHQINGSYENGWYDACAVMMRRLLETLIIEVFEGRGMAAAIQGPSGNFMSLDMLIGKVRGEPTWNLSRGTIEALNGVKNLGDKSAHARRFKAHRGDIDSLRMDFRESVQELINLAGLS